MRRADRLFQVIQILQRQKYAITASQIADELETSVRTIYRDIQDLMANRVPIQGERGTGYLLQDGYNLPPLMFNDEEIDAIMLGVEWVRANGDKELKLAAEDVLSKIGAVVPRSRKALFESLRQTIPRKESSAEISVPMKDVRRSIRYHQKARTIYQTPEGPPTERILHPMLIVFFEDIQLLVAWCELRNDIRNFRMDRFSEFEVLDSKFSQNQFAHLEAHLKKEGKKH